MRDMTVSHFQRQVFSVPASLFGPGCYLGSCSWFVDFPLALPVIPDHLWHTKFVPLNVDWVIKCRAGCAIRVRSLTSQVAPLKWAVLILL